MIGGQADMEDGWWQVVMAKAAGLSSPRMGRRIVATGGVGRRRTEPVVIRGFLRPPRRGGGTAARTWMTASVDQSHG